MCNGVTLDNSQVWEELKYGKMYWSQIEPDVFDTPLQRGQRTIGGEWEGRGAREEDVGKVC